MVSVGVSKLGVTDLTFVDLGAEVNGAYYSDVLLSQQLLPMMRTQAACGARRWHGIDQPIIDNAIDEWRCRLRACVQAKGGHFEQML